MNSGDKFTEGAADERADSPAGEVSGANLARLLGKPCTTRLGELLGFEEAERQVEWNRTHIRHGRPFPGPTGGAITNPEAGDVPVILMSPAVVAVLAEHGIAPPTRPEVVALCEADREEGGDGLDPLSERQWAESGVDLDLPFAEDKNGKPEGWICGVPQSVYDYFGAPGGDPDKARPQDQKRISDGKVIPSPNSPDSVARWLTRHRLTKRLPLPGQGRRRAWMRMLIRIDQTWYHYDRPAAGEPPRWIARTDPEWMPGMLREALRGHAYVHTFHSKNGNDYELRNWSPNIKNLAEVEAALSGLLRVEAVADEAGTATREIPDAWGTVHNAYRSTNVLCRNGVLDPATGALSLNTPLWFSLTMIPVDYHHGLDPYAGTEWLRMLRTQWPDDPGAVMCLQQWAGYVVSGRTDLQKWMLIIGPSGSGKSIIAEVLGALTGTVVATRLDTLNSQFGLQSLYETGAQLALMSDIRFGSRDSSTAVGTLLGVTGEDEMVVERKHKTAVSAKLGVRFHGSANEMPRWSDNSAALQRRALILETTRGFRGAEDEDHGLKQRILDNELGSVLRWAVEGLALLNAAGGTFTVSARAAELAADMDSLSSPLRTFIEECCVIGTADDFVDLRELFRVWGRWAEVNNTGRGMSQNKFRAALRSLYLEPIRPGQKKAPDGKAGKWLVVWGISEAKFTFAERDSFGDDRVRTVGTGEQPARDPYDR
ncbi:DNA primase family protein [Nocardia cyriacigeorgica]|uniref:SF3 helicase domain-containing protein n=1 Tax=Nocardia cyriacigeorgica (strain GUH-2) TaxID=1127134 RepID=H6R9V4_NOCCG|nr:phage/plasmid primase, P4 family [Nocardia cyriacigeorgica]CCF61162.1 protein of unknown function [Nocardia cyriacigeorgica GUH-2]